MVRAVVTIDDIPSKNTPAFVDFLKEKEIPAIMFTVGKSLEKYPDEVAYAMENGIIIGNHSYSHPHFSDLSPEECIEEIDRCECLIEALYWHRGIERRYRPFRFPYGDKGGKNKELIQNHLKKRGFNKVRDTEISYPWWKEQGMDRDIDTFWTFDFEEYRIRRGSGFTREDVHRIMDDPSPAYGAPLFSEDGNHILIIHAHDETEELAPGYYKDFLGRLIDRGVVFEKPAFM